MFVLSPSQVFDKEKVVIIPDHYIFTEDVRANRNVDILREFVREQDIKYFYDITDRFVSQTRRQNEGSVSERRPSFVRL